ARIVDYNHGAVVQVSHPLVVFLPFFQDEYAHDLPGQNDGLERVREFVDVQHLHALELRNLIKVEIVGDDLAFVQFGQLDQLEIDFADGREIVLADLNGERSDLLQALGDVETTPAAVALERIGGVGDQLQFAKHELRGDHHAIEKAGFGNIGDAAIDDHAGIENLVALFELLLASENSAESRQVEQITLVCSDHQPDVGHQQHDHQFQEAASGTFHQAVVNDQCEQIGANNAENAADGSTDQALEADPMQAPLEDDNGDANQNADGCIQARI